MFEPKALRPDAWWHTLLAIIRDMPASQHWLVPDKLLAERGHTDADFLLKGKKNMHIIGAMHYQLAVHGWFTDGPWMNDLDAMVAAREEALRKARASKDADFKTAVRDYAATRIDE